MNLGNIIFASHHEGGREGGREGKTTKKLRRVPQEAFEEDVEINGVGGDKELAKVGDPEPEKSL